MIIIGNICVLLHNMSACEKLKIEEELRAFAVKNFEKPSVCNNLEQARFYSAELCLKIYAYETTFNFAPTWAYGLPEQYTDRQNFLEEFQTQISH